MAMRLMSLALSCAAATICTAAPSDARVERWLCGAGEVAAARPQAAKAGVTAFLGTISGSQSREIAAVRSITTFEPRCEAFPSSRSDATRQKSPNCSYLSLGLCLMTPVARHTKDRVGTVI